MSVNKDAAGKVYKLSRILQVQEFIDFYVLSQIRTRPSYLLELDRNMVEQFKGIGVNISYMSRRINFLREHGYVFTYWDDDIKRNIHYIEITDKGIEYFTMMLRDIFEKLKVAKAFYNSFEKFLQPFESIDLTK